PRSADGAPMRRLLVMLCGLGAAVLMSGMSTSPAAAYGGGATHDMWQIGLSFNCNNPGFCGSDLGGFWGWAEFDRAGSTTWGDGAFAGCGHSIGGGGGGAGGVRIEIVSWHLGPAGPDDPNP